MPRRRLFKKPDSWEFGHDTPAHERPLEQPKKRRAASTLAFAALFFAGAAFTAVAGDRFAQMTQAEDAAATDSASTDAASSEPASSAPDAAAAADDAQAAEAEPAPAAEPSDDAAQQAAEAAPAADEAAAADVSNLQDNGVAQAIRSRPSAAAESSGAPAPRPSSHSAHGQRVPLHIVFLPSARPAPKPEIEGPPASATVWLNRALPDPTPPALRLSPAFAKRLKAVASARGTDWALMLGVLRAKGATGHVPASKGTLSQLAERLSQLSKQSKGDWSAALALDGSASFADRAQALARYDRAVGLSALVKGLEAAKRSIAQRVLNEPSISIYPGGRDDIANDKVNVRVLALISYLHESFGQVSVSSLVSGHRLYARPGVISAHVYGDAVDIAALGGTPVLGHQEPGGLTEQAVRDILLLPSELLPKQVISLLGLGGPSFPLADHYNHIHVGF